MPLPSLEEQKEIVARVEAAFSRLALVDEAAAAAANGVLPLERAILAKAFRGELVPQDPNDEPASMLLERIRAARAAAPAKPKRRRATALSHSSDGVESAVAGQ